MPTAASQAAALGKGVDPQAPPASSVRAENHEAFAGWEPPSAAANQVSLSTGVPPLAPASPAANPFAAAAAVTRSDRGGFVMGAPAGASASSTSRDAEDGGIGRVLSQVSDRLAQVDWPGLAAQAQTRVMAALETVAGFVNELTSTAPAAASAQTPPASAASVPGLATPPVASVTPVDLPAAGADTPPV